MSATELAAQAVCAGSGHGATPLWDRVDALVDRAARDADVLDHRLAPFAARLRRERGQRVPESFVQVERAAAIAAISVPATLARIRAAVEGELLVLKGPEVAARYPDPGLRAFGDLDLLTCDANGAHAALRKAGAIPVRDPALFVDIHHLRPVAWPNSPLFVEVHSRPKWVDQLPALPVEAVFEHAVDAAVDGDGYLAPSAEAHAVLLAVHSWAHEPLRRLRDMVDVAALLLDADRAVAAAVAREWGVGRLWRTTEAAVDALFFDGPLPLASRVWAQNLVRARGRTVLEHHLQRWFSDFSIMPPHRALLQLPRTLVDELQPDPDESWRDKSRRTALAVRNGFRRRFEHDDELTRHRRPQTTDRLEAAGLADRNCTRGRSTQPNG